MFKMIGNQTFADQILLWSSLQLINDNPDMYGVRRSSRSRKEPDRYTTENVSLKLRAMIVYIKETDQNYWYLGWRVWIKWPR